MRLNVCAERETGSKETRADPFASQWQANNVDVMHGEWNEAYFSQLESFPESKFKDMVDASANGFNEIEKQKTPGSLGEWATKTVGYNQWKI